MEMKHIVFCINDNWSVPAGVLIESILHYNKESQFVFHIISKNLSQRSLNYFSTIQNGNENITINPIIINDSIIKSLPIRKGDHVTIETYYRFLIPDLLDKSIDKALYLDCDILCTNNFKELFEIDISNYSCAMCPDGRYSDIEVFNRLDYPYENGYFCAGVILLNLNYWRKNKVHNQCIEFLENNGNLCLWHDQDAINKILNGKILYLHPKYDLATGFYYVKQYKNFQYSKEGPINLIVKKELWNDLEEAIDSPVFIHFTGKIKPWHKSYYIKPFFLLWRYIYKQCKWTNFKLLKNSNSFLYKIKLCIKVLLRKTSKRIYSPEIYNVEQRLIQNYKG